MVMAIQVLREVILLVRLKIYFTSSGLPLIANLAREIDDVQFSIAIEGLLL